MARADHVTVLVACGEPRGLARGSAALERARELQPGLGIGIADGPAEEAEALAAQLAALAAPGQVIVAHPVRTLAGGEGWTEFRELEALAPAGGGSPVRTW